VALDMLRVVLVGRAQSIEQRAVAGPHGVQLVDAMGGGLASCWRVLACSLCNAGSVPRPSRRMSHGKVRPWPTRVNTMTVSRSTRSREGAGHDGA
jgi:hypothetical protein